MTAVACKRQRWPQLMPVWHWQAPIAHLPIYLASSLTVAVGGIAKALRGPHRERDPARRRELEAMRKQARTAVIELCARYPNQLHILGCNDLHTLDAVKSTAYSVDTSKWLDGGRYGYAIFRHTGTGRLSQAPAKALPIWHQLDRRARCIACATNLVKELT